MVNSGEHLNKLILPDQGDRTTAIIEREGGSRLNTDLTLICCDLVFTGSAKIALGLAAEHRRLAHPGSVKRKRFVHPKVKQAEARESGSRASRGET